MRSHLTRLVFRRLLWNEGFTFQCPNQLASYLRARHVAPSITLRQQRRTIFGFSAKSARKPKPPQIAPGMEKIFEFSKMRRIKARLPPAQELLAAWRLLLRYKLDKKETVTNYHAVFILRLFNHLRDMKTEDGQYLLTKDDLRRFRKVFLARPKDMDDKYQELSPEIYPDFTPNKHTEIAKEIHAELVRREDWQDDDVRYLVEVLAQSGESAAARSNVQEHFGENTTSQEPAASKAAYNWKLVLAGFARENNEQELLKTAEAMEKLGIRFNGEVQKIITCFFASRDDVEATKKWYGKRENASSNPNSPSPETMIALYKFSIRNNELEWCKGVFKDIIDNGPKKHQWDVIFQWAAGAVGKGVEDVERMMDIMVRRNPDNEKIRPDVNTINGLVELANSLGDPYLAERYISLGLKHSIRPNCRTYILQMDYRVDAGDLSGAQAAYEALQAEEILEDEDLPVINKYIRALCSKSSNYDRIMGLLSDLEVRRVSLEAATVSAVCMIYMDRDEIQNVYDLLQTNVYQYMMEDRTHIRNAFYEFCMDRRNTNTRAWESYQVLRQMFDEANTDLRTELMIEFFDRGRSDMACYVFGHMRQHVLGDRKPKLETYIQCLEGIALCGDAESLEMVHNMFKMDSNMEPNTRLYNALMLAYSTIGNGDRALDYWADITNSNEGPTYRSLDIVFRACQMTPFGVSQAREIWGQMRRMDIEITLEVFNSYIGALAGGGKLEEPRDLVDNAEKEFGLKPDFMTIGIFYNAIPGQNRKDLVEDWAKSAYPEAWAELEKKGQTLDEDEWQIFKIKRDFKA